MSNYRLKESTPTVYFISRGRERVGQVVRRATATEWVGRINKGATQVFGYGPTVVEAFREVVAASNRVDLCGKDDKEAARAALEKLNEETRQRNERYREVNQELVDTINEVARDLNVPVRAGFKRGRARKFCI